MNTEPEWIPLDVVLAIHTEQLAQHGGAEGVRDQGLLESALMRPQQLWTYAQPDLHDLAAAYAHGLSRNHPFMDGNKRTAWVVARLFLLLHGLDRTATDEQCYLAMLELAAGEATQEDFARWLRAHTQPV